MASAAGSSSTDAYPTAALGLPQHKTPGLPQPKTPPMPPPGWLEKEAQPVLDEARNARLLASRVTELQNAIGYLEHRKRALEEGLELEEGSVERKEQEDFPCPTSIGAGMTPAQSSGTPIMATTRTPMGMTPAKSPAKPKRLATSKARPATPECDPEGDGAHCGDAARCPGGCKPQIVAVRTGVLCAPHCCKCACKSNRGCQ